MIEISKLSDKSFEKKKYLTAQPASAGAQNTTATNGKEPRRTVVNLRLQDRSREKLNVATISEIEQRKSNFRNNRELAQPTVIVMPKT
ncbi:hypothetical protein HK100_010489, partial [Physocladia obscura]